ncbi:S1C family serine protease [Polyangium jinanense]|uniref:Serine protease n=1 Tax=Polyangium jinanense TaxID=2829994 RepID=A0A9X3WXD4_9BACT|nr:S1C family serine protease [Polyangium jinanense]MDC3952290.1 serine protease [Polyangium jinanense]MDC3956435.1 serine protease [Polyangium jinanense]MDC3979919.1 serine protease [Polyangium jinanense]MDC3982572.1 serine protease [Polyangium jinanense]
MTNFPASPEKSPAFGHTSGVKNLQRWSIAGSLAVLALMAPTAVFAQAAPAVAPADVAAPPVARPQPNAPPRRIAPPPQLPALQAAPPAAIPPAPAADPNAPADPNAKKEPSVEEKALRGVVAIERAGQPLSLGAALAGDGRILAALSPLGSGNDLEARFADGSVVRVKLGHHDRTWDLALLVPQSGRWTEGLVASTRDPLRTDATIRSFAMGAKGKPSVSQMVIRGRKNLLGADDATLANAFELGSRISPLDLGAPIVDEDGRVVALLGRGCSPNEGRPCTPVAFGIPINAIRSFLRTVPPTAVPPAAWLGIQGSSEVGTFAKGVRVQSIHPDSPAAEAKLKGGDPSVSDMIVAVDGVPVTSPEQLAEVIRTHAVGEKVPLTVFGQGKYRQVTVALRQAPDPRAAPKAPPAHPAELPTLGDAPPPTQARPRADVLDRRR